jgi:cellulose synthase operon protein YhjQ
MEDVIALERERFLQNINDQRERREINGSAALQQGQAPYQRTKYTVWRRLQDALAPRPNPAPLSNAALVMPPAASALDQPFKAASNGDNVFREASPLAPVESRESKAQLKTRPGDARLDPELSGAAADENGVYSMKLYWTGTGFEERRILVTPKRSDGDASEPLEQVSPQASPLTPSGAELPGTKDGVEQKMEPGSDEAMKSFPRPAEAKGAENAKNNDGAAMMAGQVRYDPMEGIWIQVQSVPAAASKPEVLPDSDSVVAPAPIAVEQPQQTPASEAEPSFSWTSWFRIAPEEPRVLITPPPAAPTPAESQPVTLCQETSEVLSLMAAQDEPATRIEMAPVDKEVSAAALSLTAAQDEPARKAQTEAKDENHSVAAPISAPDKYIGGNMWQPVTDAGEAISNGPRFAGDKLQTADVAERSRWFVLKGVLGETLSSEPAAFEPAGNVPVLEVFSLAGGVGKTSLVATLGRALSACGERVLLVEAAPLASLQYFFGACDCRPGVLRTFRPPATSSDAPIRLATVDVETPVAESSVHDSLAADIQGWAHGAGRVIVDVATRSTSTVRGLAKMSPVVLVPLVPDVNSVVTAKSIDSFFQRQVSASGGQADVFYVLNQFDPSLPLHQDVRNVLRERLGKRLLPIALERTPAISEALAEGMTIMDYAPGSQAAAEFTALAKWLEEVCAPAAVSSRGRWSEQ